MKHTYFLILWLLLLVAGSSRAQDYRPFRAGLTYQFSESATPGDTTHTLRLTSAHAAGTDSVFQFNPMVQVGRRNLATCSTGSYVVTHIQRPDNLFGATLTVPAAGSQFVLTAQNGHGLTLRPRAALNQPWAAGAGFTAQVTARAVLPVLGQPDSVVTISLSNGQVVRLSKQFGLVEGPALIALLNSRYPSRALTLTALPELSLGTSYLMPKDIFDFQPQDVFLRYSTSTTTQGGQLCTESWTRDSVLTRTVAPNGDLVYAIWHRTLMRAYGVAGAPFGFCGVATGTVLRPAYTDTLRVNSHSPMGYNPLSNSFDGQPRNGILTGMLAMAARRSVQFNNRMEQEMQLKPACSASAGDSLYLVSEYDNSIKTHYGQGLGQTRAYYFSIASYDVTELIGYRKNGVTHGQLRSFAQLLPTAVARPAATTAAFPNPFSQELAVRFELPRPQAVALELHDALGRVVLTQQARPMAAGAGTIQLATGGLPAGIYTAVLKPASGPVQALKVIKTQ